MKYMIDAHTAVLTAHKISLTMGQARHFRRYK